MKKNMNTEIFNEYFKYQNSLYLLEDLCYTYKTENEKIIHTVNDALIELRNTVITKKKPKNENPEEVINIVEEILNFNKQQKRKRTQNINF